MLPSGHRIIPSEKAMSWGLDLFTKFPDLLFYPAQPNELILSCFDDSSFFDEKEWQAAESWFLDISSDIIDIDVYAPTLRRDFTGRNEGWTKSGSDPDAILQIGDWMFLLEMLVVPPPDNIDPIQGKPPFRRAFRLHRKSFPGGKDHVKVLLLHPEDPDIVAPPFRDYASKQHPNNRYLLRTGLLRDVIRAFLASASKIHSVRNADAHLLNYAWRTQLGPGGLVGSIGEKYPVLSKNLEAIIRSDLWINIP